MTLPSITHWTVRHHYQGGRRGELRYRFSGYGTDSQNKSNGDKSGSMGDPIEIRLRGYTLTLRVEDAKNIEITQEGVDL